MRLTERYVFDTDRNAFLLNRWIELFRSLPLAIKFPAPYRSDWKRPGRYPLNREEIDVIALVWMRGKVYRHARDQRHFRLDSRDRSANSL